MTAATAIIVVATVIVAGITTSRGKVEFAVAVDPRSGRDGGFVRVVSVV